MSLAMTTTSYPWGFSGVKSLKTCFGTVRNDQVPKFPSDDSSLVVAVVGSLLQLVLVLHVNEFSVGEDELSLGKELTVVAVLISFTLFLG